jgi:hypothetical protein
LTRLREGDQPVISPGSAAYHQALLQGATVFETMHDARLLPAHNGIPFFQKDNADYLPKGSTEACLKDVWPDEHGQTRALDGLEVGDVLIFEERRNPRTGLSAGANPAHRHAVRLTRITRLLPATKLRQPGNPAQATERPGPPEPYVEIEWAAADALPFALCIAPYFDGRREYNISVARGNVVLVDHGRTIRDEELPDVQPLERYRPRLRLTGLTHAVPYYYHIAQTQPASAVMQYAPQEAVGCVRLRQRATPVHLGKADPRPLLQLETEDPPTISALYHWTVQGDLLNSGPFDRDYLVETEEDGAAYLRFGFEGMGRLPLPGDRFVATYRIGNGTRGNVGAGTIAHVVADQAAITGVRNPLPARGGRNPEDIESARLDAPHAFRTQQRCVTEGDYAAVASRHPAVAQAVAQMRWIGSGHTAVVYVQRAHGQPEDDDFRRELRAFMEPCRLMGYEIAIEAPRYVPLRVKLRVYLEPRALALTVHQALSQAFGEELGPDGKVGFFHPDRFGFGQSVHQSQVIARAMGVAGVARVEVEQFRRVDSAREIVLEIPIGPREITRLDRIEFDFESGS